MNVLLPHVNEEREGATIDPDALSLMEIFLDVDPCVAVSVTVCDALTAATVAANGALIAPEATVTEAGTAIALLLLVRFTVSPVLGAAADNVTVQLSVPAPVMEVLVQLRADREAVPEPEPFPCSLMELNELLVMFERLIVVTSSVPVESAVDFASK